MNVPWIAVRDGVIVSAVLAPVCPTSEHRYVGTRDLDSLDLDAATCTVRGPSLSTSMHPAADWRERARRSRR